MKKIKFIKIIVKNGYVFYIRPTDINTIQILKNTNKQNIYIVTFKLGNDQKVNNGYISEVDAKKYFDINENVDITLPLKSENLKFEKYGDEND